MTSSSEANSLDEVKKRLERVIKEEKSSLIKPIDITQSQKQLKKRDY